MPASCKLIFRVSFGHAFFADGVLRDVRIVPVPACFDMLRRAGLLLRPLEDGIAVYGDERAVERLRFHIAQAGASLGMAFQVFFTNPHFFEFTAPAWPAGKLLFLDTADSVIDEAGRQVVHASPFVEASAFLERDDARLTRILGERVMAPTPAMVMQVDVAAALLDVVDARRRHFHIRFDAAPGHWHDEPQKPAGAQRETDDLADASGPTTSSRFRHFAGANIADQRRAHLFVARGALQMREVSPPRLRRRGPSAAAAKGVTQRVAAAGIT